MKGRNIYIVTTFMNGCFIFFQPSKQMNPRRIKDKGVLECNIQLNIGKKSRMSTFYRETFGSKLIGRNYILQDRKSWKHRLMSWFPGAGNPGSSQNKLFAARSRWVGFVCAASCLPPRSQVYPVFLPAPRFTRFASQVYLSSAPHMGQPGCRGAQTGQTYLLCTNTYVAHHHCTIR